MYANIQIRSKRMSELLQDITEIPADIRKEVLTQFIGSC